MPTLQRSHALVLDLPVMGKTHQKFVQLLDTFETTDEDALLTTSRALIDYTEDHFDRDDPWRLDTLFCRTTATTPGTRCCCR